MPDFNCDKGKETGNHWLGPASTSKNPALGNFPRTYLLQASFLSGFETNIAELVPKEAQT